MKTLLKIAVAALVLNAVVQAGLAQWRFFQFKDAVEQAALFSAKLTEEQLATRVLAEAETRGLPLGASAVEVQMTALEATVRARYVEPVTLVPRTYTREWPFELDVTVRRVP